jgi:hypothetical protein
VQLLNLFYLYDAFYSDMACYVDNARVACPIFRGAATLYARYQYTISRADLLLTKSAAERQWRERLT